MPRTLASLILALSLVLSVPVHKAQAAPAPASPHARSHVAAELAKLSPELAEQATAMLAETDERKRAELAGALARKAPAVVTAFLFAVVSIEQAASVRLSIVDSLGRYSSPR